MHGPSPQLKFYGDRPPSPPQSPSLRPPSIHNSIESNQKLPMAVACSAQQETLLKTPHFDQGLSIHSLLRPHTLNGEGGTNIQPHIYKDTNTHTQTHA